MIRSTNYDYACERIHLVNYRQKVTPNRNLIYGIKMIFAYTQFHRLPQRQTNFIGDEMKCKGKKSKAHTHTQHIHVCTHVYKSKSSKHKTESFRLMLIKAN